MTKKIILLSALALSLFANVNAQQEERYSITNLDINDDYSNFGTTFYGENQVVYASPTKKRSLIKRNWKGNDQPFLDLFIGDISSDGQLENIKKFSKKINSKYHESDVAFTKDLKTVYFSRNNYLDRKTALNSEGINLIQLYRAKISKNGDWTDIEEMPFNSDQYQTGHPALSNDGKTLYFISDMPGTLGLTDVYKASIDSQGNIGKPVNLGPKINTAGREMFVTISGNDELYFSSDGRPDGHGGLDVYVSQTNENGITKPQNLGAPINSDKDDFAFIINKITRRGYFSSNRSGGKGDDDIYTFVEDIPINFECKQVANGVARDKKSGALLPQTLVTLFNKEGKKIESIIVGTDAAFKFDVDCENEYKVVGEKTNYKSDEEVFVTSTELDLELDLTLNLKENEEFVAKSNKIYIKLDPIYFNYDKYDIRPDAEYELWKVINIMTKYPDLIVEGGSHTDSRGRDAYNETLSANRAKSTVKYIIQHSGGAISWDRISARGYGEVQPVNRCVNGVRCSESEHQQNRRTEFVIKNPEVLNLN